MPDQPKRVFVNPIVIIAIAMVLVLPAAVILIAGGTAKVEYFFGFLMIATGLFCLYKAVLIWSKGQPRGQILVYILYGIGSVVWGVALMKWSSSGTSYLSLVGFPLIFAGGVLRAHRVVQGKDRL